MKIKTCDLHGPALDWAVAHCVEWSKPFPIMPLRVLPYSTDWAQAGPIIEREGIAIDCVRTSGKVDSWVAAMTYPDKEFDGVARAEEQGPTPLVAAMRCYVASKLGDEVDVPF